MTAFLGGLALGSGDRLGPATWAAITPFVVLVAGSAYTLAPGRQPGTAYSARKLLADYVDRENPAGIDLMHRELALHLERERRIAAKSLNRLRTVVQLDCVLLIVEMLAWLIDLQGRT